MGNCEVTLAALLKLIDADYFPQENPEWAKSTTDKLKTYLLVIKFYLSLNINFIEYRNYI